MSRSQALKTFNWAEWKSEIKNRGVRVLTCGLDEVPGVYKDIRKVMAHQMDLVNMVARFDPKLVKMSDDCKNEDRCRAHADRFICVVYGAAGFVLALHRCRAHRHDAILLRNVRRARYKDWRDSAM